MLDQVFSNNECLREVSLKAPFRKSDHACIEIEVKVKPDGDYIK